MKNTLFSLLLVVPLISLGCADGDRLVSPEEAMSGAVLLTMDLERAPASVASVEARLTRSGFDPIFSEMSLVGSSTAELTLDDIPVGDWHLEVEAKNEDDVVQYAGEADVTILEDTVTDVSLVLYPVSGGTGGIHLVVNWGEGSALFLVLDEDVLDNGRHFNSQGGGIIPDGPDFFSASDVNDGQASETQRDVLDYFRSNVGRTITLMAGQTGDEGWFAPNCIPARWNDDFDAEDNTCLSGTEEDTALRNYTGLNGGGAIPTQERLDKIPDVRPLRALGLNRLIGSTVHAVVYDSDIGINYDLGEPLGVNGNLQGETLGVVIFRVNGVRTLSDFSSSTLPEVQVTILDASGIGDGAWSLLTAPLPASSSVPNDRVAPGSPDGYFSLGQ